MKKILYILSLLIFTCSCADLDLNPPSSASSENWYSDKNEYELSINDFYRKYLWNLETGWAGERLTDNWSQRQVMNEYAAGTINSEWGTSAALWKNTYKGIARANTILENLTQNRGNLSEVDRKQFEAEARAFRAIFYGRLLFFFGDVPFYTQTLTIEEAFKMGRTDKKIILQEVYNDFNFAINNLPIKYNGTQNSRLTKGAALAFKAKTALNLHDYEIARKAAEECIKLNNYKLHSNYGEYFLSKTKNSSETVFAIPRSAQHNSIFSVKNFYTRNAGGSSVAQPSWELFATYLCTDGKTIDQSPLFDPQNPFKNRDPRLKETIVEFGTDHLGYIYDPNPYSTNVLNTTTGKQVKNKDTRSVDTYASYNGLTLKKGVDTDWSDDSYSDADIVIMRYADVLLMYAEAKIELNQLDSEMLKAFNQVRARAYNDSGITAPLLTISSQTEMRKYLRIERRVEFAWENRRIEDIMRWKHAEIALTRPNYGMLDPDKLKKEVVDKGLWFWSETPTIDENGLPVFDGLLSKGKIKVLATRAFDKNKQYLWPIPSKEIIINSNLTQNPGY
ncbi:RagB/SusD family nutrient uptake outer membrane protein [Myroides odoratimimus]|uniref:RagB/SusD family nutrient uptake outer membrane protein n=1 Tax=Myroides odoratimimus TaxID=76832 RepID=UPI002DBC1D0B|nr:RagB/SusD family nutrient uptake outer membrane protein [Myroides odoratimimus]MEC4094111.1 RagB/SusD family nutrient uptake outer membrane protein [Myroides odoratimimus]